MTVSRRHARLRVTDDGLWIEDLDSSNGTSVDSRRLSEAVQVEAPCRLGFGGVRADIEELAAGDLVSAIRVSPLTVAQEPVASPSDTGGRTLSSSALEELTLRRLPPLIEELASGPSPIEAAQRVGADFFHSLPCYELEIWHETPGGKSVWFSARTETLPSNPSGTVAEQAGPVHIQAGFVQSQLARQLAPLIRVGIQLVRWTMVQAPAGAPGPRRLEPGEPAKLPEPATVDLHMQGLYAQAERVARSDIGILIYGESGDGQRGDGSLPAPCFG